MTQFVATQMRAPIGDQERLVGRQPARAATHRCGDGGLRCPCQVFTSYLEHSCSAKNLWTQTGTNRVYHIKSRGLIHKYS